MSSQLIKNLLATAVIVAATVATGTVSAAPVLHSVASTPAHSLVQPVHWIHRHGHRVWVSDRHHH